MKVLFIGGTGVISSASSQLALDKGIELYHLNRGISSNIRKIEGIKLIHADKWNFKQCQEALKEHSFDAVVDWMAFEVSHIENDIKLFSGKTKQFIFISSASAYQTPPKSLPITEETPLDNPIWKYSQNKIACEERLKKEFAKNGFPYTIVRPSHTYDKTLIPMEGGWTVLDRMKNGKPVVVHGDGSSIWTLTNHRDFAKGLVGLLGNEKAIANEFHITSDEWLSWTNIFTIMAEEIGVVPKLVYRTSEEIAKHDKDLGDSLLGDKTHSMIFDNSKLKAIVPDFKCSVPFREGAKEIVKWYNDNPDKQIVDKKFDKLMDDLCEN